MTHSPPLRPLESNRTMKPNPRVLLVNDNPDENESLDSRLRALGYRTSLLQDGEQALDVVSRDPPDLVVLDAQDITGDPVATVHLPARVPAGFHGNWCPDA